MKAFVGGLSALLFVAGGLATDAEAQNRKTRDRLEEIERQLNDLQGAVFGEDREGAPVRFQGANPDGSAPALSGGANADLMLRIGTIESELQRINGEVERLSFMMRQQDDKLSRLISLAYPELEGEFSSGPVNASASSGITGGPVDLVSGGDASDALPEFSDAEAAYRAGRSALLEARYDDAERAFLAITENFSDSERAGDATYYLGETYLAQGDLGAAARVLLDFIRQYPEHERAAEAHLKLGQAFARAEKTREACRVWQRGLQQYPEMNDNLRTRMTQMREATCS